MATRRLPLERGQRVLAYVYGVFARSGRSKSQKCKMLHFLNFCAPGTPESHFCIRVRRFCSIRELKNHTFGAPGAVRRAVRVGSVDERTDRHLIPGTGRPMAGTGAPTDPPAAGGGRQSKHILCGGPQAFPPHSNMYRYIGTFCFGSDFICSAPADVFLTDWDQA